MMRARQRLALAGLLGSVAALPRPVAQRAVAIDPVVVGAKLDAEGLSELLVPIKVEGHTFWCNVDSGGSWVFSLDTEKALKAGLRPNAAGSSADVGPNVRRDQRVQGMTVEVGSLVLRNITIVLGPRPSVVPDIDCVFGLGLLQDYVVEFDYVTPQLRIFETKSFQASATATAVPFKIDRFRNPYLEARIRVATGGDIRATLILDTGGGYYAAALTKPFLDANRVMDRLGPIVSRVSDQPGLELAATRPAALTVGPFELEGPVVALLLTPSAGIIQDGLLGAGFFTRFTVTLDYTRAQLWLEPNGRLQERQPFDASGLEFRPADRGYVVALVTPGSPGANADLQNGDHLLDRWTQCW